MRIFDWILDRPVISTFILVVIAVIIGTVLTSMPRREGIAETDHQILATEIAGLRNDVRTLQSAGR